MCLFFLKQHFVGPTSALFLTKTLIGHCEALLQLNVCANIKALWDTNNQWKRIPYGYFMVALVKKCFAPLLQRSKYRECADEEATFSRITFYSQTKVRFYVFPCIDGWWLRNLILLSTFLTQDFDTCNFWFYFNPPLYYLEEAGIESIMPSPLATINSCKVADF